MIWINWRVIVLQWWWISKIQMEPLYLRLQASLYTKHIFSLILFQDLPKIASLSLHQTYFFLKFCFKIYLRLQVSLYTKYIFFLNFVSRYFCWNNLIACEHYMTIRAVIYDLRVQISYYFYMAVVYWYDNKQTKKILI